MKNLSGKVQIKNKFLKARPKLQTESYRTCKISIISAKEKIQEYILKNYSSATFRHFSGNGRSVSFGAKPYKTHI